MSIPSIRNSTASRLSLDGSAELPPQANDYPRNLFLAEVPQTSGSPERVGFIPIAHQPLVGAEAHIGFTPSSTLSSAGLDRSTSNNKRHSPLPELAIKPSPSIDPEDLAYLTSTGVFNLPPPSVVRDLLGCFINYVYPLLPILDIQSLLEELDGPSPQINLPLLYGIMLAASGFAPQDTVEQAGFRSRFEWRKGLGRKLQVSNKIRTKMQHPNTCLKLLYDFDYESDRLIMVQTLLLMTYFHDKVDDSKHLWHKIINARYLALTIGLNNDLGQGKLDDRKRRLWKRIWWSCYIRDRTCALGVRQYPTIDINECHWTDLELEDFEIKSLPESMWIKTHEHGLLSDTDLQSHMAKVCLSQLQLWHLLSDIMHTRFKPTFPRYGITTETSLVLIPVSPQANREGIEDCQQSLDRWFATLPEQYAYRLPSSHVFELGHPLLRLHACMLCLLYNGLQCVLNRWALSPNCNLQSAGDIAARQKGRSSANMILSIFEYLHDGDMIQYTPGWSVTILMQAALTFKTESRAPHSQAGRRLQDCTDVLEWLKDHHFHANFGVSLIKAFLKTADVVSTSSGHASSITCVSSTSAATAQETPLNPLDDATSQQPLPWTGTDGILNDISAEPPWLADFLEQEFWSQDNPFESF
ncbi:hypothetical protein LTR84_002715 [Exophiala bonariae]|uniref:Xylanolytic transcriptional activator regulatory domain-containing protein n=1 Tax=Exophiala bonariae TaxID=1690606 RepID=A0AAV9N8H0_9EURO|nr:hypothetical protein LTR84_002715 [Exophiala bonariae]